MNQWVVVLALLNEILAAMPGVNTLHLNLHKKCHRAKTAATRKWLPRQYTYIVFSEILNTFLQFKANIGK